MEIIYGPIDWYKILSDIVNNYNNTYHRTIKTTPMKIKSGEDTNHQSIVRVSHDFKTGDKVRKRIDQNIYSKSDVIFGVMKFIL